MKKSTKKSLKRLQKAINETIMLGVMFIGTPLALFVLWLVFGY